MSATNGIDSWNLRALEHQIQKEVQPQLEGVDQVKLVPLYLEYALLPSAPKDIDVFDYINNEENGTQVWTKRMIHPLLLSKESFSNTLKEQIEIIEKAASEALDPEEQRAVQISVILLRTGHEPRVFIYEKK